jgi:hypothetical protein
LAANPGKDTVSAQQPDGTTVDIGDPLAQFSVPCGIAFRGHIGVEGREQFFGEASPILGRQFKGSLGQLGNKI